jgi:hypothetical protein
MRIVAGLIFFKLSIEYSKSLDNYYDGVRIGKDIVKVLAFLLAALFSVKSIYNKNCSAHSINTKKIILPVKYNIFSITYFLQISLLL